jgi:hypothetical protein
MWMRTLRTFKCPAMKSEEERGRMRRFEGREICVFQERREALKRGWDSEVMVGNG